MKKIPDFENTSLLHRALTHSSYTNEHPEEKGHNERLEFLGDAILSFLSAEYLYDHHQYPEMGEDEMTRRRSALVDEKQLARFASDLNLNFHMRLGKGMIQEGGFQNPNLLSSTFEALVAAYYLDQRNANGRTHAIESVHSFVKKLFESVPEETVVVRSNTDSKNRLQEWAQKQPVKPEIQLQIDVGKLKASALLPVYTVVKETGADHTKEFTIEVKVQGELLGQGKGKSKKEAEKKAAEKALNQLRQLGRI
ncbi:Ribonuclease 3 [Tumidithrix helvetica PCC 7403]|uniref:ribonuclease III n=1 Tax=Tumidithrix helvetica TaxID=3457545 RepID=UPI003C8FD155